MGTSVSPWLEAKSDLSTGNQCYASYVLRSHDLVFAFSAPYGVEARAYTRPLFSST
jgi:hypothetical protein